VARRFVPRFGYTRSFTNYFSKYPCLMIIYYVRTSKQLRNVTTPLRSPLTNEENRPRGVNQMLIGLYVFKKSNLFTTFLSGMKRRKFAVSTVFLKIRCFTKNSSIVRLLNSSTV